MADNSKIEWTDATWQPITGCSIVSPGCTNCYAMRLAGGRLRHHPSRKRLTTPSKAGPVWNGQVRFNEAWLTQPLGWREPKMIFVCAHGDLFHESVPDEWIDKVLAVGACAPHHTLQILTKRAARMREYFSRTGERAAKIRLAALKVLGIRTNAVLPLPNVWLGVSAERQEEAGKRIPDLLATPAAVRFLSAEPLLGPIDLMALVDWPDCSTITDAVQGCVGHNIGPDENGRVEWDGAETCPKLDWVIAGGESGHGARPMKPDWARGLRDQCVAAGVPFFFKQHGEYKHTGGDGNFIKVGKKRAGRLLDGREWNEMPAAAKRAEAA